MHPLDDSPPITIESVTVQHALPAAIDDIPSPDEVRAMQEFEEFAERFPVKDPNWTTLLLVGRDCMRAQVPEEFFMNKEKTAAVIKTPLGWTVVGRVSKSQRPINLSSSRQSRETTTSEYPTAHVRYSSQSPARASTQTLPSHNPIQT